MQIRAYMRAIFAEAVDQDFFTKDPARTVRPPTNLREVDKTTLSWDQLRAALEKLDELSLRDWILMKLDMSNALRPSELFPIRWRCLNGETQVLDIQETIYKGDPALWKDQRQLDQGSNRRGDGGGDLGVPRAMQARGQGHLSGRLHVSGALRRTDGLKQLSARVLHRLAKELGLPKLNFQVIRRTIATLGKNKGHPKDIQGMMRHTRLATTMRFICSCSNPRCGRRLTQFTMN